MGGYIIEERRNTKEEGSNRVYITPRVILAKTVPFLIKREKGKIFMAEWTGGKRVM
jgi:hypothetical protein